MRRLLIEKIGYDRLCQELTAETIDTWREYSLVKIDMGSGLTVYDFEEGLEVDEEPICLLKMTCPSTGHIHALRVPPDLTAAREAIRWTNWDIDPEAFAAET
jgi:hypothetical protein